MKSKKGFAIGLVLLAVVLIAGIVAAIAASQSDQSDTTNAEQARVAAASVIDQATYIKENMKRAKATGVSLNEMMPAYFNGSKQLPSQATTELTSWEPLVINASDGMVTAMAAQNLKPEVAEAIGQILKQTTFDAQMVVYKESLFPWLADLMRALNPVQPVFAAAGPGLQGAEILHPLCMAHFPNHPHVPSNHRVGCYQTLGTYCTFVGAYDVNNPSEESVVANCENGNRNVGIWDDALDYAQAVFDHCSEVDVSNNFTCYSGVDSVYETTVTKDELTKNGMSTIRVNSPGGMGAGLTNGWTLVVFL